VAAPTTAVEEAPTAAVEYVPALGDDLPENSISQALVRASAWEPDNVVGKVLTFPNRLVASIARGSGRMMADPGDDNKANISPVALETYARMNRTTPALAKTWLEIQGLKVSEFEGFDGLTGRQRGIALARIPNLRFPNDPEYLTKLAQLSQHQAETEPARQLEAARMAALPEWSRGAISGGRGAADALKTAALYAALGVTRYGYQGIGEENVQAALVDHVRSANEMQAARDTQMGATNRYISALETSALPMAVLGPGGTGLSAIPGGVAITQAMLTQGGQSFGEAIDADKTPEEARAYAAKQAIAEGVPAGIMSMAGMGGIEGALAKLATQKGVSFSAYLSTVPRELVKNLVFELPEEAVTTKWQRQIGLDRKENKETWDADDEAQYQTLIQTLGMVGQTTASQTTLQGAVNALRGISRYNDSIDQVTTDKALNDEVRRQMEQMAKPPGAPNQGITTPTPLEPTIEVPTADLTKPPTPPEMDNTDTVEMDPVDTPEEQKARYDAQAQAQADRDIEIDAILGEMGKVKTDDGMPDTLNFEGQPDDLLKRAAQMGGVLGDEATQEIDRRTALKNQPLLEGQIPNGTKILNDIGEELEVVGLHRGTPGEDAVYKVRARGKVATTVGEGAIKMAQKKDEQRKAAKAKAEQEAADEAEKTRLANRTPEQVIADHQTEIARIQAEEAIKAKAASDKAAAQKARDDASDAKRAAQAAAREAKARDRDQAKADKREANRNKDPQEPIIVPPTAPSAARRAGQAVGKATQFAKRMFTGRGASADAKYGKGAEAAGRAHPIMGRASYMAHTKEEAARYGDVTEQDVTLDNPLILNNDKQWGELLKAAGTEALHSASLESADRVRTDLKELGAKLQNYIKLLGHDGVIVELAEYDPNTNDPTRRMAETFDVSQVIKFDRKPEWMEIKEAKEAAAKKNIADKAKQEDEAKENIRAKAKAKSDAEKKTIAEKNAERERANPDATEDDGGDDMAAETIAEKNAERERANPDATEDDGGDDMAAEDEAKENIRAKAEQEAADKVKAEDEAKENIRAKAKAESDAATQKAAPAPKAEAPAPKAEAPAPKAEAPAPKAEAPAPKAEAPAPKAEAPAPKAEAPAPKAEPDSTDFNPEELENTPEISPELMANRILARAIYESKGGIQLEGGGQKKAFGSTDPNATVPSAIFKARRGGTAWVTAWAKVSKKHTEDVLIMIIDRLHRGAALPNTTAVRWVMDYRDQIVDEAEELTRESIEGRTPSERESITPYEIADKYAERDADLYSDTPPVTEKEVAAADAIAANRRVKRLASDQKAAAGRVKKLRKSKKAPVETDEETVKPNIVEATTEAPKKAEDIGGTNQARRGALNFRFGWGKSTPKGHIVLQPTVKSVSTRTAWVRAKNMGLRVKEFRAIEWVSRLAKSFITSSPALNAIIGNKTDAWMKDALMRRPVRAQMATQLGKDASRRLGLGLTEEKREIFSEIANIRNLYYDYTFLGKYRQPLSVIPGYGKGDEGRTNLEDRMDELNNYMLDPDNADVLRAVLTRDLVIERDVTKPSIASGAIDKSNLGRPYFLQQNLTHEDIQGSQSSTYDSNPNKSISGLDPGREWNGSEHNTFREQVDAISLAHGYELQLELEWQKDLMDMSVHRRLVAYADRQNNQIAKKALADPNLAATFAGMQSIARWMLEGHVFDPNTQMPVHTQFIADLQAAYGQMTPQEIIQGDNFVAKNLQAVGALETDLMAFPHPVRSRWLGGDGTNYGVNGVDYRNTSELESENMKTALKDYNKEYLPDADRLETLRVESMHEVMKALGVNMATPKMAGDNIAVLPARWIHAIKAVDTPKSIPEIVAKLNRLKGVLVTAALSTPATVLPYLINNIKSNSLMNLLVPEMMKSLPSEMKLLMIHSMTGNTKASDADDIATAIKVGVMKTGHLASLANRSSDEVRRILNMQQSLAASTPMEGLLVALKFYGRLAMGDNALTKAAMAVVDDGFKFTVWRNIRKMPMDKLVRFGSTRGVTGPDALQGMVDGGASVDEVAARIARDLFGDTLSLSPVGTILRASIFPFYGWFEVSMRTTIHQIDSLKNIDDGASAVSQTAKFIELMFTAGVAITMYNTWKWGPEEAKRAAQIAGSPYLILSIDDDGTQHTMAFSSVFADMLGRFGIRSGTTQAFSLFVEQDIAGIAKASLRNFAFKVMDQSAPGAKQALLLATGWEWNSFSHSWKLTPIEDRAKAVAVMLDGISMHRLARMVDPNAPYHPESLLDLIGSSRQGDEVDFFKAQLRANIIAEQLWPGAGIGTKNMHAIANSDSVAYRNYMRAIRAKDMTAATQYLAKFFISGKGWKNIEDSMGSSGVFGRFNEDQAKAIMAAAQGEDKALFDRALVAFDRVKYSPLHATALEASNATNDSKLEFARVYASNVLSQMEDPLTYKSFEQAKEAMHAGQYLDALRSVRSIRQELAEDQNPDVAQALNIAEGILEDIIASGPSLMKRPTRPAFKVPKGSRSR
jgi:hypothetical protein